MTMRAATKSWKEKCMPIIVRVEVPERTSEELQNACLACFQTFLLKQMYNLLS